METELMIEILNKFIIDTEVVDYDAYGYRTATRGTREECLKSKAVVQRIFQAIDPNWNDLAQPTINEEFSFYRDVAIQILGVLEQASVLEKLSKTKELNFPASHLRTDLWTAIHSLWSSNHYREAVAKGGEFIDGYLKEKVKRGDISGVQLIQEVFSLSEPQLGKPRLCSKLPNLSEDARNEIDGLRSCGVACISYVRNLSTHSLEKYSENMALERVFTFNLYLNGLDKLAVIFL